MGGDSVRFLKQRCLNRVLFDKRIVEKCGRPNVNNRTILVNRLHLPRLLLLVAKTNLSLVKVFEFEST